MDGGADVAGVGAELDGQARFSDEVPGGGADDAAADDAVGGSSNSTLVMPSSRPRLSDRPLAAQGNTPLPYLIPAALASFSVTPTQATSGSV